MSTLEVYQQTVHTYRKMIDETIVQLSDEAFFRRPAPGINSVAIILRHLGGNLTSRWTDFLTTDGEKDFRNRDLEFAEWEGTREELMDYFEGGWQALINALAEINEGNLDEKIVIRGEPHTVIQALVRSVTHITYHVGQISLVARMVHEGEWNWLTIAPNQSKKFNQETWGTSKSRAVFGSDSEQTSEK